VTLFRPHGIPLHAVRTIALAVDGLEALRHADHEGLDHESAAKKMEISQPTFSRILAEARRAVAAALVGGHALRIEGGNFRLADDMVDGRAPGHCHCGGEEDASGCCRHGHHGHEEPGASDAQARLDAKATVDKA
jgi:predicted DNA-binding protein (UPF0251 family)